MADLLIRGMKLPKNLYGAHIIIKPNGDVQDYLNGVVFAKAIELPEHGRLIDAEKLQAVLYKWEERARCGGNHELADTYQTAREIIDDRDCVVEGSRGSDN